MQFCNDSQLICSDHARLTDMFTYCSDDGLRHSWIDHIVCSMPVDNLIETVYVDTSYYVLIINQSQFIYFTALCLYKVGY